MNAAEYALMAEVEQRHWWYASLRALTLEQLEAFGMDPEARVVDVGCGTGGTYKSLAARYPGVRYTGVDIAPEALALSRLKGPAEFLQGDVAALPVPPGQSDAALCLDVLYHRGVEPRAALKEIFTALRPGGLVVVNVPAFAVLEGSHDRVVDGARRFTTAELRGLLRDAGLEPVSVFYWNSLLFLPILVWRRLSRLLPGAPTSDLNYAPSSLDPLFRSLLKLERRLARILHLPFGTSAFAVARKA